MCIRVIIFAFVVFFACVSIIFGIIGGLSMYYSETICMDMQIICFNTDFDDKVICQSFACYNNNSTNYINILYTYNTSVFVSDQCNFNCSKRKIELFVFGISLLFSIPISLILFGCCLCCLKNERNDISPI